MSKVLSFRLDDENPDEREALAILEEWQEKGYSTREIMTWALMALSGMVMPEEKSAVPVQGSEEAKETINELREVLGQAHEFLEVLRDMQSAPPSSAPANQGQKPPRLVLTEEFLATVRNKVARPGLFVPEDESGQVDS